jgi:hypothetical protein
MPANDPGALRKLNILVRGETNTEQAPHGTGNVYAPEIHRDGKRWLMWYGGQGRDGHDRIHLAESEDGTLWKKRGVVLDRGTANHVNDPSVVRTADVWWMYYTVAETGETDEIAAATSKDGVTWKKRGVVLGRGAGNAWDSLKTGRPSVLYEGGVFKMWYDGQPSDAAVAADKTAAAVRRSGRAAGYATSRDGLTWERHAQPVLEGAGALQVAHTGNRYVMVHESGKGILWAESADGLTWKEQGLLAGLSGDAEDRCGRVTPFFLPDTTEPGGTLFFGAASERTWDHNKIASQQVTLAESKQP